ncbi:hypothetical protein ACIOEX_32070 [Streptomyces sp. NPDC087850]|uniref:hypothetical protein n=1 Tax=Streptomyces sp. NPDC087850 TaxID=3365809 RepID=UPI00381BD4BE
MTERCAEFQWLPRPLLHGTLAATTPVPGAGDGILRTLECSLPSGHGEQHYALVCELDGAGTGAIWAPWTGSMPPTAIVTLPDCPYLGAEEGGCILYAGHGGDHQDRTQS